MADFWSTSGLDLLVATQRSRRRASLEEGLRRAIQEGRLPHGTRLPSTRALASDLGWSRGTVTAAYDRLVAEGYLHAREGSGTRVALRARAVGEGSDPEAWSGTWRFDLRPGTPPIGSFPLDDWLRHQRAALREAPNAAVDYGDPAGTLELRRALTGYLGRVRGVRTTPDHVVVTAGITQALSLLARVLGQVRPGLPIATEDPGFGFHRSVIAANSAGVVPIAVDSEGADPRSLAGAEVAAVVVTPSHQYPTGATMSATRRSDLVNWSRDTGAWIVEDDYDGELRHDRASVPALQADAPERVIYAGTASKALGPALRLGWLVVPDEIVEAVVAAQKSTVHSLEALGQLTLAHVIDHHAYDRRVRSVRVSYRRRLDALDALVGRLARDLPGLRLGGARAGGQAALLFPAGSRAESDVIARGAEERLGLEGLSVSSHRPGSHAAGLLIGFSRPAEHRYRETLAVLERVLRATC